ncbi:MAG: hypothetical protein ACTSX6_10555 [Candidatus Heimdallarchaeaceae archaeon]
MSFTCKICGKKTKTLPAMLKHYRKIHPATLKQRMRRRSIVSMTKAELAEFITDIVYDILKSEGLIDGKEKNW